MLANPLFQLTAISLGAVLIQNLLFKKLSDQAQLRELRKRIDSVNVRFKEVRKENDPKKLEKVLAEMNEASMKRLKLTMKPNLLSSLVFILVFGWMQTTFKDLIVSLPVPLPILSWSFPFVSLSQTLSWFWWYLYIAIIASIIFRELLEIEL